MLNLSTIFPPRIQNPPRTETDIYGSRESQYMNIPTPLPFSQNRPQFQPIALPSANKNPQSIGKENKHHFVTHPIVQQIDESGISKTVFDGKKVQVSHSITSGIAPGSPDVLQIQLLTEESLGQSIVRSPFQ